MQIFFEFDLDYQYIKNIALKTSASFLRKEDSSHVSKTISLYKWKSKINEQEAKIINRFCRYFIKHFNYPLDYKDYKLPAEKYLNEYLVIINYYFTLIKAVSSVNFIKSIFKSDRSMNEIFIKLKKSINV